MKSNFTKRSLLFNFLPAVLSLTVFAFGVCSVAVDSYESTIRGRIHFYDWVARTLTVGDDFVVSVTSPSTQRGEYVRIVYLPMAMDAPPEPLKSKLPAHIFLARGRVWEFRVYSPSTSQEKASCRAPAPRFTFDDELGTGDMSAYIATPGADPSTLPRVEELPCYVLVRGGVVDALTKRDPLEP